VAWCGRITGDQFACAAINGNSVLTKGPNDPVLGEPIAAEDYFVYVRADEESGLAGLSVD